MNVVVTEKTYPIRRRWLLQSIVLSIPVSFCLFAGAYGIYIVNKSPPDDYGLFISKMAGGMAVVLAVGLPIVALLRRRTFHYTVEEHFLMMRQGILSKQERRIPYQVIQTVMIHQNILDKMLGLAFINIENAAGGTGIQPRQAGRKKNMPLELTGFFFTNKVIVPGLSFHDAELLENTILQKINMHKMSGNALGV